MGIFHAEEHWLRSAIRQALKWIALLTLGMTLAGLFDLYKQVIVDVAVATVAVAFAGVSLLVALGFLTYAIGPRKRRARKRPSRTPRPRMQRLGPR